MDSMKTGKFRLGWIIGLGLISLCACGGSGGDDDAGAEAENETEAQGDDNTEEGQANNDVGNDEVDSSADGGVGVEGDDNGEGEQANNDVGNDEDGSSVTVFLEGWEATSLGNPSCEVSQEGFSNCAFTGDSGQWLVTELRDTNISTDSPIPSVEILTGKMIKLQTTAELSSDPHLTGRGLFSSLKETSAISFTDHSAELGGSGDPVAVTLTVYFEAPGGSFVPCPGAGVNVGDTSIRYVFETNPGYESLLPSPLCSTTISVGAVSSFSRNLYDDFVDQLPFLPEGWNIMQITLNIHRGSTTDSLWATWDSIRVFE